MVNNPKALWGNCLDFIRENVTEQQFKTWFEPIVFESYFPARMTVLVQVPSPFVYEYLEENFVDLISKVLRRVFGSEVRLEYHIVTDKTNNMVFFTTRGFPASYKYFRRVTPLNADIWGTLKGK
jgi:chromosomal replication initiator protein